MIVLKSDATAALPTAVLLLSLAFLLQLAASFAWFHLNLHGLWRWQAALLIYPAKRPRHALQVAYDQGAAEIEELRVRAEQLNDPGLLDTIERLTEGYEQRVSRSVEAAGLNPRQAGCVVVQRVYEPCNLSETYSAFLFAILWMMQIGYLAFTS